MRSGMSQGREGGYWREADAKHGWAVCSSGDGTHFLVLRAAFRTTQRARRACVQDWRRDSSEAKREDNGAVSSSHESQCRPQWSSFKNGGAMQRRNHLYCRRADGKTDDALWSDPRFQVGTSDAIFVRLAALIGPNRSRTARLA